MDAKRLGLKIRSVRKRRRLSMQAAADKAGLARNTWLYVENGSNITLEKLEAVCGALGVSVGAILRDVEEPPMPSLIAEALRRATAAEAALTQCRRVVEDFKAAADADSISDEDLIAFSDWLSAFPSPPDTLSK